MNLFFTILYPLYFCDSVTFPFVLHMLYPLVRFDLFIMKVIAGNLTFMRGVKHRGGVIYII